MKSASSLLIRWSVMRCCFYKITYLMRQEYPIEKTQARPQVALAEHFWTAELAFLQRGINALSFSLLAPINESSSLPHKIVFQLFLSPECLEQWLSNLSIHQYYLEVLLKPRFLGPTPEFLIQ